MIAQVPFELSRGEVWAAVLAASSFLTFIAINSWRIARYMQSIERIAENMWTRSDQTRFAFELKIQNEGIDLKVPVPSETPRPAVRFAKD